MTLGGGVLNYWAKKQRSVALSSWESELFAAITSGTRSLEIQSELVEQCHCRQTVRASLITRSAVVTALHQNKLEKTLDARSSGGWETGA